MAAAKKITARVSGRVQGVGFRYFTRTEAARLGLNGWVRNERDGTVLVVAEGAREELEQLVHALKQGPGIARVRDVDVQWEDATGGYADFRIG